jgi:hypothetical protein
LQAQDKPLTMHLRKLSRLPFEHLDTADYWCNARWEKDIFL